MHLQHASRRSGSAGQNVDPGLGHFVHLADIHAFAELLQERSSDVRGVAKAAEEKMNKFAKSKRAIDRLKERRFQYPDIEKFDS